MTHRAVSMTNRVVGPMDDGLIDVGLGCANSLGERQPFGQLCGKSTREGAACAVGVGRVYASGTEVDDFVGLAVVEDVDELVVDEVSRLEQYRYMVLLG